MRDPVGLLALQGDFEMHRQAFAALETPILLVRRGEELDQCAALVIPGGESTTLARLIDQAALREPLAAFAKTRPVMGTCAGLILMARELSGEAPGDHGVASLSWLDCVVLRNGYGRQVDSFTEDVSLAPWIGDEKPFPAVYIRAPRILSLGDGVEVLGRRGEEPVAIRQGHLFGFAFHPELTTDRRVHEAFLTQVITEGK